MDLCIFCLTCHQPCSQCFSWYWRYFSKLLKTDKTTLSPWYFIMRKLRNIISKNILVRATFYTAILMSLLFLLKLEVSKQMKTQVQNYGIKLCLRVLFYFCLSKTKGYWESKRSKMSKHGVFSGLYFPVFGMNTEICGVNLRIQSEYRKIRTRKNSVFEQFSRSDSVRISSLSIR